MSRSVQLAWPTMPARGKGESLIRLLRKLGFPVAIFSVLATSSTFAIDPITGSEIPQAPTGDFEPCTATTLIDFDSIEAFTPTHHGDIIPVPESVVTTEFVPEGVLFGKPDVSIGVAVVQSESGLAPSSPPNSVVGLDADGVIPGSDPLGCCIGDIFFSFLDLDSSRPSTTDFVSFTVGDAGGDLDKFTIRAFDLDDQVIDSQNVSGVSRLQVAIRVSGIHRVEVDFFGSAFGYSLDDLCFETPTSPEVPAASNRALLVLLLLVLTASTLVLLWRRRSAA